MVVTMYRLRRVETFWHHNTVTVVVRLRAAVDARLRYERDGS